MLINQPLVQTSSKSLVLFIHQPIFYNLHYDHIIFSFENCYKLQDFHAMEHSMFDGIK
jgi:hypothetical protein